MADPSAQTCAAQFTEALIRRDMGAALERLTDDVVFFYSNGSTIVGKAAFATLMTGSWKIVSDYTYTTLASNWFLQSDDAAAVIYNFEWSGVAGGNPVSGGGRGTRVLKRFSGGLLGRKSEWLIAHEHLSAGQWLP